MGQESSISDEIEDIVAYQVVRVMPLSPAERSGLSPYFDFILEIDDIPISEETLEFFAKYITKSLNQPLKMKIYNTKTISYRDIILIPSIEWSNSSGLKGLSMKLGCTIRYESVRKSLECVWHVLEILENSPAQRANLKSEKDFIVGSETSLFHEVDDFKEALKNPNQHLYVYNTDRDSFRYVLIERNENESIGCDIGTGFIHRIPIDKKANLTSTLEMNHLTVKLIVQEEQKNENMELNITADSVKVTQLHSPRNLEIGKKDE